MRFFERPHSGERAVLVHPGAVQSREDLEEAKALAQAASVKVVAVLTCGRKRPDPRWFIGRGKVEELKSVVEQSGAELILFNHPLSPSQERNLERDVNVRVVDRIGLILDIFAQRARTHEGKLQVELAQLKHLETRLVRGWTHLERQRGGIGLRGPGETQLEMDRRLIRRRIRQIERQLKEVAGRWERGRQARKKRELPTVALVGYTNAGKSTLFNALTGEQVYAADQLFATLDSTLRRLELGGRVAILADTVGFIRHLPHELIAAFRATLQEACEAEIVLHVIDAASPRRHENIEAVYEVLGELGIDRERIIEVYNKIDLLNRGPKIDRDRRGRPDRVWLSAAKGEGLDLLREAISERLEPRPIRRWVRLRPSQGGLRAKLFRHGTVLHEQVGSEGEWLLEVELSSNHVSLLKEAEEVREIPSSPSA